MLEPVRVAELLDRADARQVDDERRTVVHHLYVIEPGLGGADRLARDVVLLEERDPFVAVAFEEDGTGGGEERARVLRSRRSSTRSR